MNPIAPESGGLPFITTKALLKIQAPPSVSSDDRKSRHGHARFKPETRGFDCRIERENVLPGLGLSIRILLALVFALLTALVIIQSQW